MTEGQALLVCLFSKDTFKYDNILKGKRKKGEVFGVKPQIHRISLKGFLHINSMDLYRPS